MRIDTAKTDPFAAADAAHGQTNPEPHRWPARTESERYTVRFSHFEERDTRDGRTVETLVGQLRDGSWSREWLFEPENGSRGWRAQQHQFIGSIRSDLEPGDVIVMELEAARPKESNPDQSVRPFTASHFKATADDAPPDDEEQARTHQAAEAERDERDAALPF